MLRLIDVGGEGMIAHKKMKEAIQHCTAVL
jgi:hypothetical protein